MRTQTLLLAALAAVLLVVPRSVARPHCKEASYVKAEKSSQSTQSAATSSSSADEEYVADSAAGQVSSRSSKSSSSSVSSSSQSNSESYEGYSASGICDDSLEEKQCGECLEAYYRRIFVVEESCSESVSGFYTRVFKQYKGESDAEYINRINFIFTKVYPKLDCRCNDKYIKFLEKYYTVSYAKKSGECDADYFKRVLTKTTESQEVYIKKVSILKKYVTNVEWSSVKIDAKSKTGYTLVTESTTSSRSLETKSATTGTKSTSATTVERKSLTEAEIKSIYAKTENEDITTYYKRIVTKSSKTVTSEEYAETVQSIQKMFPTLDLWYEPQYLSYVKDYYTTVYQKKSSETEETYYKRIVTKESYETDECFAKRMGMLQMLLPTLPLWSSETYYESMTKKFYETYYKKSTKEDETTYYSRITTKLEKESEKDYINRMSLVRRTYCTLPLWYSKEYLSITKSYYTAKYTKLSSEKEETYYKRIVTKESYETDEEWAKRMVVLQELLPTLTLWSDNKYYESCTKKYIQIAYKRSQSEDETSYYSRLVQKYEKESTTEYYNRVSMIKGTFCSLPLWYSKSYLSLTKQYYTAKYTKQSTEKDEVYYKRIVAREVGETDEAWAQRVDVVHRIFPSLTLWWDSQYYEAYTKQVYSSVYKQSSSEDVTTYYTRICSRFEQESDSVYAKRLSLLMKTFSKLDLWHSDKYISIVKEYLSLTYTKQAKETEEAYVARLLRKECVDTSDEIYAKRVHLVHTLTASSSVWSKSCYYEKYLSAYYSTYYARVSGVSCEAWLTTVLTPLAGESEDAAVARVTLVKRAVSGDCDCWTDDVLTKVTRTSCFSSEYISKIRSACFTSSVTTSSSSSSSSSVASSSTSESEEVTIVSRD